MAICEIYIALQIEFESSVGKSPVSNDMLWCLPQYWSLWIMYTCKRWNQIQHRILYLKVKQFLILIIVIEMFTRSYHFSLRENFHTTNLLTWISKPSTKTTSLFFYLFTDGWVDEWDSLCKIEPCWPTPLSVRLLYVYPTSFVWKAIVNRRNR